MASYPTKVIVGSAFLVTARIELLSPTVPADPTDSINTDEWRKATQTFYGSLRLALALAGTDVQPATAVSLTDGRVTWSVMPRTAGEFAGVITPSIENPLEQIARLQSSLHGSPMGLLARPLAVTVDGDTSVKLTAVDNLFATSKLLSWLPQFFGTMLTVPGILAFYRGYKQQGP